MNSKLFPVIVIGLFSLTLNTLCAQVAINNSATNPDPSAILDLNSGNTGVNKGFLAPQVSLTNVTVTAPVISPATGLIVYSTTAPSGGNGAGYYYWNGSAWSTLSTIPTSLPPNGTAGGNLSGTYPNPTVSEINGASVQAAGSLTTGNVLQVNGASSTTYAPIN